MEKKEQKIIRCIAYIKNNNLIRKCRNRIKVNKEKLKITDYFCCKEHLSKNIEDLMECCDVCSEEVSNINEVIILKCNHAYHKNCYFKWLNKNENNICPICMFTYFKHKKKLKKKFINKKENNFKNNYFEEDYFEEENENNYFEEDYFNEENENDFKSDILNIIKKHKKEEEILNKNDYCDNITIIKEKNDYINEIKDFVNKIMDKTNLDNNIDLNNILNEIDNCKKSMNYNFIEEISNILYNKIKNDENTIKLDDNMYNDINKNIKNIKDIIKINNITDEDLQEVLVYKILNCGLFDKEDFDEYFDIKSFQNTDFTNKHYELLQNIPDINIC
jgi:hypothetical protein